ncbi:MAG: alanine racemase [Salinibacterium sp.]|nr:alanine racemase [Salinibacterium sp.]MBF0671163.1 alanine racemase [Salinibacterium sp.]
MTSEAIVDLTAFGKNVRHLRSVVAPAEFMVVLKADAYGHGLVPMARAAVEAGAQRIGVLDVDSALAVREAGVGTDTMVMAWQYGPSQDFSAAVAAQVDLGVSQQHELRAIADAAGSATASVHLKIDTGLNRNGAAPQDWPALVSLARSLRDAGRIRITGVWSHIAEASEDEDTESMRRFERAIEVAGELGVAFEVRHLAASSAGLRRSDIRYDMVRMGGHCWGIPSFDGVTPSQIGIIPVMTLTSEVTSTFTERGERMAVLALGHAQGIPAKAAGRVSVAIAGRRAPVRHVGTDFMLVAVDETVCAGDIATLFGTGAGGEQTVREWGDLTDTLGDEIVTRIARGVPRRYVGSASGE